MIIVVLFCVVVLSIVYFPDGQNVTEAQDVPEVQDAPEQVTPDNPPADYPPSEPERREYPPVPPDKPASDVPVPGGRPWLVFVIDDAGYNMAQLKPFLDSPAPLTIAVLPHLPYSKPASEAAYAAGKEVILHMPMQAIMTNADPGPGAIYSGQDKDAVTMHTRRAFESVPHATGANNHMGSRITQEAEIIEYFLAAMQGISKEMFFLDSRTTANSVAALIAAEKGVPVVERDIFLDNDDNRAAIIQAIEEGKSLSKRRGYAVMIGHIWSEELGGLITEYYPELLEQGFYIGTLSELIYHLADENR
ncbi:MAG: divergent polysaccharide deacetylase family protein [Spirochaeta sp.]